MREHVRSGTEAVDGLRGVAIALVVAYHTYLFSWYTPALAVFGIALPVVIPARDGYLGVDLFFTISGFVLFFPHAMLTLGAGGAVEGPLEFARRRFVKIVPSYAIALVATLVVSTEYLRAPALWTNFATHAAFVQNAFDDGFGKANSVFWSLAIEVQFYLVFPLVARAFRRYPFPLTGALFAIAFVYRHVVGNCCLGQETVMRQLPAYLDLFASGMLAAYCVVWMRARGTGRFAWAFTAGAALAIWFAFAVMQSADVVQYDVLGPQRWDLSGRSLVALATGCIVAFSCLAARPFRAILANPATVFLSIVSYNVYLWHALLMVWMWLHDVPHAATPNPHDDPRWKIAYIALGWTTTLAVATALTYFVERPLLGTIKPQRFAFDWSRVVGRRRERAQLTPPVTSARPETRT